MLNGAMFLTEDRRVGGEHRPVGGKLLAVDDELHIGAVRGVQQDAKVAPYVGGLAVMLWQDLHPTHDDERAIRQAERLQDASLHELRPTMGGIWWEDMH